MVLELVVQERVVSRAVCLCIDSGTDIEIVMDFVDIRYNFDYNIVSIEGEEKLHHVNVVNLRE